MDAKLKKEIKIHLYIMGIRSFFKFYPYTITTLGTVIEQIHEETKKINFILGTEIDTSRLKRQITDSLEEVVVVVTYIDLQPRLFFYSNFHPNYDKIHSEVMAIHKMFFEIRQKIKDVIKLLK